MPQTTEQSLQQQMMAALGLTEADFRNDGGDLMVRADLRVVPWLKQHYQYWTVVQNFRTKGSGPGCTEPWPEGFYLIPREASR